MVRASIDASSNSDAGAEAAAIGRKLRQAGIAPEHADRTAAEVESVLAPLLQSASLMAANGSRMVVTQTVAGPGHAVDIRVSENVRPTLMQRLVSALGRRR